MYCFLGDGGAQDHAETLRLYQLTATQGHPVVLCLVAFSRESGCVAADVAEANRWYRRAQASGHTEAEGALRVARVKA